MAIFTIASCAQHAKKDTSFNASKENSLSQTDSSKKTISPSSAKRFNGDTLIVESQAAVFIEPDSIKIEKLKKEAGVENFYAAADDYLFYLNSAYQFIDSVKLMTIQSKDKKFIKFIRNDKSVHVVNLNKLPELWNIYFFDPTKNAKRVNMTIIEEEYGRYFK
jgi:hypothetical protein